MKASWIENPTLHFTYEIARNFIDLGEKSAQLYNAASCKVANIYLWFRNLLWK